MDLLCLFRSGAIPEFHSRESPRADPRFAEALQMGFHEGHPTSERP